MQQQQQHRIDGVNVSVSKGGQPLERHSQERDKQLAHIDSARVQGRCARARSRARSLSPAHANVRERRRERLYIVEAREIDRREVTAGHDRALATCLAAERTSSACRPTESTAQPRAPGPSLRPSLCVSRARESDRESATKQQRTNERASEPSIGAREAPAAKSD